MQLLTATLTKPARQVTTRFGERTVADVRLADGTETTIWRPANDQSLANLTAGQSVTVAKDSKGKVNLIDNPAPTAPTTVPAVGNADQTMDADTKRALASYVEEMGNLYVFCYSTAGNKLPDAPMEASQAMASSLFIACQRKFDLA